MSDHSSIAPVPASGHEKADNFRDVEEIKHRDDDIGHVEDMLVDGHIEDMLVEEETWALRDSVR